MKPDLLKWFPWVIFVLFFPLLGCFSSQQIIARSASPLFNQIALSANQQADVSLVRQGMPAYLMLLDGMIQQFPDNQDLLLAGAQAYSSYASLLEEDEEGRSPYLYGKAKIYALRALDLHPLFKDSLKSSLDNFQKMVEAAGKNDLPLLFGVGSIWGTWIAQGPDPVEGMADLPRVEALMERVLQLDPGFYYGGAHLFKGILLSSKPEAYGGNLQKAEEHFKLAIQSGEGKFLLAYVYYAQYVARQRLDRDLFVKNLNYVLSRPVDQEPRLTLANTLAQKKAKKLLDQLDEFF